MDFTIVTPSFNQLDYLACCIASVADQAGITCEHIIQDGGTAGFSEFAKEMESRWPERPGYRRLMISEKDSGMYDAVNKGLKHGAGKICAYLNCDEQYLPGILEKVRKIAGSEPSVDLWVGDVIVVDPKGQALCQRKVLAPFLNHVWTCHLPAFTAATFFQRRVIEEGFFFDTSYRAAADAEWFVRLLQKRKTIQSLDFFCSTFTDGGGNLGLTSTAAEERKRVNRSAGSFKNWLSWLWVGLHRMRRLANGCHRARDIETAFYLQGGKKRTPLLGKQVRSTWPGRLWQK
jgi:glycosyltransferase involved in cell wall biosynthesis